MVGRRSTYPGDKDKEFHNKERSPNNGCAIYILRQWHSQENPEVSGLGMEITS